MFLYLSMALKFIFLGNKAPKKLFLKEPALQRVDLFEMKPVVKYHKAYKQPREIGK